MATLMEIVAAKESIEAEILKRPGVTGVDVGFKYVDGKRTEEIVIRVHVAKKHDVPKAQMIPSAFDSIKTDVIERVFVPHPAPPTPSNRVRIEDITIMADTGRYDPLKGGISIGPCRSVGGYIFAGTLGAIVKDNASGNHMLLSNFHVMCVDTGWHVGDDMCQPSRVDGGHCPADVVGTLQRAVLDSSVDAAVSSVAGRGVACEIVDIGAVAGTASAVLNAPVRKRGRTTALTYGFVDSISLSVNVDYGDGIGAKTLTNQIGIRTDPAHNPKFGDHGDSGSVVVNDSRQVVGLYFAGSDDGFGVANPIAAVLAALNISMCVPLAKLPIKDAGKDPIRDTLKEVRKDPISDTLKEVRKDPISDTVKEIRKDPVTDTIKELAKDPVRDPTVKEVSKEPIRDTLKEATADPTLAETVIPGGPGPEQPGPLIPTTPQLPGAAAVPFIMAGGSQFGGGGGLAPAGAASDVAALAEAILAVQQQYAELEQQYAELTAAYDAAVEATGGGGA